MHLHIQLMGLHFVYTSKKRIDLFYILARFWLYINGGYIPTADSSFELDKNAALTEFPPNAIFRKCSYCME